MSELKATSADSSVRVADLERLIRDGVVVIATSGRTIAVFHDEGRVFAVDNRCPHMGFPLHRGTVRDGILTCHWHHAKFDLAGGCTFDPFADDVQSFATEVLDGVVFVDPTPTEEDPEQHWLRKIDEGLEHNISLVLAKAVVGLEGRDIEDEIIRRATLFGVRNRASGWNEGLSILSSMANVLDHLKPEDRPKALFHGLVHVARVTQNLPADFDLSPPRY
jgi:nitrite reductase/ring-hydroxylating ferredoxin subunit